MALVLEIEHLLGIAFAARGPDSAAPDWPPQPDRVFSALVAAWGARGEAPEERAALEWLERQPPPLIAASPANTRPAPISYVPPNDPKSGKTGNLEVMPDRRPRQARRFPAALPHDPTLRLVWTDAEGAPVDVLDAVARDVAYVGHSASLTRCRFTQGSLPPGATRPAARWVYHRRLQRLIEDYSRDEPKKRRFPSPGDVVLGSRAPALPTTNAFSPDWVTLEITGGALDLRAAPLAAKALRDTLMAGYGRAGLAVPEWVSGHAPDGAPTQAPHLAVVPLAYAGFAHADGRLMGFAFAPPSGRSGPPLDDADFRRALFSVTGDGADERREVQLALGRAGVLRLAVAGETERASLDPARYVRRSAVWATVTPMVLPRHLKGGGPEEMQALIATACTHSGLPRPKAAVAHKHAAVTGAPSAWPSGSAPRWTGWRVPERVESRGLTHAVLRFEEPIEGPVLIGAGRFHGLGLCLPLDAEPCR